MTTQTTVSGAKNGMTRRLSSIRSAPMMARYVIETCTVLRMLRDADTTLTYGELAEILGLRQKGERWRPSHIGDVNAILDLTAEMVRQTKDPTLTDEDFLRIVNATTGTSGRYEPHFLSSRVS